MKITTYLTYSLLFVCMFILTGCPDNKEKEASAGNDRAIPDEEMSAILFPSGEKDVLTGGDGAISIPVGPGKSIFLWGDSFFGEVTNNSRDRNTPLVQGNVWQFVEGTETSCIFKGTVKDPKPWLATEQINGYPAVLWPGHGFLEDNVLHVFMSVIVLTGTGTWDFYWESARYYRMSYPDLAVIDSVEIAGARQNGVHYAYGVHKKDEYYYVYGTKPEEAYFQAPAYAARLQMKEGRLQDWEYYDGKGWSVDPLAAQEMKGIDAPVAEQFNIFPYGDKYILLFHERPLDGNKIYSYIADKPEGPWRNKKLLYEAPETAIPGNVYSYNAMAHPQYDKDNSLLVCYCMNSHDIQDVYEDASIYKPRFIRVPYSLIMGEE